MTTQKDTLLLQTIRALVFQRRKKMSDLVEALKTSVTTFYKWLHSPDWEKKRNTIKAIDDLLTIDLVSIMENGGIAFNLNRRKTMNKMLTVIKHIPGSFGDLIFRTVQRNNTTIVALAKSVGTYPAHLSRVSESKGKLDYKVYRSLCNIDSAFRKFVPWSVVIGNPIHDHLLRERIANGEVTQEDVEVVWPTLKGGDRALYARGEIRVLNDIAPTAPKDGPVSNVELRRSCLAKVKARKAIFDICQDVAQAIPSTYIDRVLARGRIKPPTVDIVSLRLHPLEITDGLEVTYSDGTSQTISAIPEDYESLLRHLRANRGK
jgi:hypothetical protein